MKLIHGKFFQKYRFIPRAYLTFRRSFIDSFCYKRYSNGAIRFSTSVNSCENGDVFHGKNVFSRWDLCRNRPPPIRRGNRADRIYMKNRKRFLHAITLLKTWNNVLSASFRRVELSVARQGILFTQTWWSFTCNTVHSLPRGESIFREIVVREMSNWTLSLATAGANSMETFLVIPSKI